MGLFREPTYMRVYVLKFRGEKRTRLVLQTLNVSYPGVSFADAGSLDPFDSLIESPYTVVVVARERRLYRAKMNV